MVAAELPKVTDWMQGWGSLAGVLVSTLAVIITGFLLRHEMRARREDTEDREAAQARLISTSLGLPDVGPDGYVDRVIVTLKNYSAAPIYDLSAELRESTIRDPDGFIGIAVTGSPWHFESRVLPGDEIEMTYRFEVELDPGDLTVFGCVFIRFTDAAGLPWERVGTAPPVRLRGLYGDPVKQDTFWSLLWLYLWPISAPIRRIRRFRQRLHQRATTIRQWMIDHMKTKINQRISDQHDAREARQAARVYRLRADGTWASEPGGRSVPPDSANEKAPR
ncbi:hypothetical protein ACIBPB_23355 [Micromonospora sp. NPDC049836]|uniref:hypothetical protein n=1 Tax=Micromonospora sp. NPDC049836 TaxID=3364274 RepID=UPI0037BDF81A